MQLTQEQLREIDEWLAEGLMGWHKTGVWWICSSGESAIFHSRVFTHDPSVANSSLGAELWQPCQDDAQALKCLDKAMGEHGKYDLGCLMWLEGDALPEGTTSEERHYCNIWRQDDPEPWMWNFASYTTRAIAICCAAIRVLDAERQQPVPEPA